MPRTPSLQKWPTRPRTALAVFNLSRFCAKTQPTSSGDSQGTLCLRIWAGQHFPLPSWHCCSSHVPPWFSTPVYLHMRGQQIFLSLIDAVKPRAHRVGARARKCEQCERCAHFHGARRCAANIDAICEERCSGCRLPHAVARFKVNAKRCTACGYNRTARVCRVSSLSLLCC